MAWDTDPINWQADYLRSQVFNTEIRDRQRHIFKRPREQVIISSGTLTATTSWGYMDVNNAYIEIETTGRPLLFYISTTVDAAHAGVTAHPLFFDIQDSLGRYASALGERTQVSEGAFQYNLQQVTQYTNIHAWFYIDWLTVAGVYTLYPMWKTNLNGISIPTTSQPLDLSVEEL